MFGNRSAALNAAEFLSHIHCGKHRRRRRAAPHNQTICHLVPVTLNVVHMHRGGVHCGLSRRDTIQLSSRSQPYPFMAPSTLPRCSIAWTRSQLRPAARSTRLATTPRAQRSRAHSQCSTFRAIGILIAESTHIYSVCSIRLESLHSDCIQIGLPWSGWSAVMWSALCSLELEPGICQSCHVHAWYDTCDLGLHNQLC